MIIILYFVIFFNCNYYTNISPPNLHFVENLVGNVFPVLILISLIRIVIL